MQRHTVGGVDGLRAIAALGVLVYHASVFDPHIRYPATLAWMMLGGRGVDLFFVISGFCLSIAFLQRRANGNQAPFDVRRYAWARVRRIIPPYFATLLLFGLLALTPFGLPLINHAWHDAIPEFLAYFLFIFHDLRPPLDGSIWTLGIESRWYVLFPMLLALYLRSRWLFAALGIALYLCYYLTAILVDIGTLPCFMLGIVAADITVRKHAGSPWILFFTILSLVAACTQQFRDSGIDYTAPLWHLTSFFIVLTGVGTRVARKILDLQPLRFLGIASYSIYLVHMPLLAFAERHGAPQELTIVLSILAGLLFWRCIEAPSMAYFARTRAFGPDRGHETRSAEHDV